MPALGVWASADPLAVHSPGSADLNLYAYVRGQLLRGTDPTGLDCGVNESCVQPMTSDGRIPAQPDLSGPAVKAAVNEMIATARPIAAPPPAPAAPIAHVENPMVGAGAEAVRIARSDPNPVAKAVGYGLGGVAVGANLFAEGTTAAANGAISLYNGARNTAIGGQDANHAAVGQIGGGIFLLASSGAPVGEEAAAFNGVLKTAARDEGMALHVASASKKADPLVPELVADIERLYPGHVKGVDVGVTQGGKSVTDLDIVLGNAVLQIKSGGGTGATTQWRTTAGLSELPVIVFGPDLKGSVMKGIQSEGGLVTRDRELLLKLIKP